MLKKIIITIISIITIITILTIIINIYIYLTTKKQIITIDKINNIDYILVLGAKVSNNKPSIMLKDRLDKAYEIYNTNKNIKIILSGDGQNKENNEVKVMQDYLINLGVNKDNIILDKEGLSTSNSIYNLKNKLKINKVLIITQEYHLYRSLYISNKLNIESYGIPAKKENYQGWIYREIREILARVKDFFKVSIIN